MPLILHSYLADNGHGLQPEFGKKGIVKGQRSGRQKRVVVLTGLTIAGILIGIAGVGVAVFLWVRGIPSNPGIHWSITISGFMFGAGLMCPITILYTKGKSREPHQSPRPELPYGGFLPQSKGFAILMSVSSALILAVTLVVVVLDMRLHLPDSGIRTVGSFFSVLGLKIMYAVVWGLMCGSGIFFAMQAHDAMNPRTMLPLHNDHGTSGA